MILASTDGISGETRLNLTHCSTFKDKFLGLMGQKSIPVDGGILLQDTAESILNASIHMFFMRFDIAVFWLNSNYQVVDKALAKKWKPYYAPSTPARYTIETHPDQYEKIPIGAIFQVIE